MRLLISSLFYESPFEKLQKHAHMVKECAYLFKEALDCHIRGECKEFDLLTEKVAQLESEADAIKRNIRNHLPRGIFMPVDKFQFLHFLREQDKVLDEVEEALFWISFRPNGIPEEMISDIRALAEAVIQSIERLYGLVEFAIEFFRSKSEKQRVEMKGLIQDIRRFEREADLLERGLKFKTFGTIREAIEVFHLIRLIEIIGNIADHAQNASDRMRAMIAK